MANNVDTKNPCRMRRPNQAQKIGAKGYMQITTAVMTAAPMTVRFVPK